MPLYGGGGDFWEGISSIIYRFTQLHKEVLEESNFMKNIYKENRELFEYISKNSGENITDIVHLDYVFDTLLIESIYGMELPDWTKKVYPGQSSLASHLFVSHPLFQVGSSRS